MKPKFILVLIPIILNSSCFLVSYKQQPLEKRVKKHLKDISQTDTTKISFRGVYLARIPWKYNTVQFIYFKFFPNGKMYRSNAFSEIQKRVDIEALNNGKWHVYWVRNDNMYVEDYNNGYTGYFVHVGHFSENNKKIIFTEQRLPKSTFNFFAGRIIGTESETLELQE